MNKKYVFLSKKPRIYGVTGFFKWRILEKKAGVTDAKENQVCETAKGHITPWIDAKERFFNSYIDKIYLKTVMALDETVEEANSLVVELNLLQKEKINDINGCGEEVMRQKLRAVAENSKRESRKKEILIRISSIKAESDMVDEALNHHIESARNILDSHISAYWRGVLKSTDMKLAFAPVKVEYVGLGRDKYIENRMLLVDTINNALKIGGVNYEGV